MKLKGITWNHSRGTLPMVATAQRYSELNPGVEIEWSKRSLQEFADKPLNRLIDDFDLLIIDHPWMGYVARTKALVPLQTFISDPFLEEQAEHSVGMSYASYFYDGQQWALPVDTAAPVASSRPDLLQKADTRLPQDLNDLLHLADQKMVGFPGIPIDTLMNFYMFCSAFGEDPFQREHEVVSTPTGIKALEILRELAKKIDPACFDYNPIKLYEAMTQSDTIAYCPFAYGYVNYARRNYSSKPLQFHDLVKIRAQGGVRLKSTLGGAGMAVSAKSDHTKTACDYAAYVASPRIQQSIYVESGGQPGHKTAWKNKVVNDLCDRFFEATLPALERAFLRPRYDGYTWFQDHAGLPVREFMMKGGDEKKVLEKLNHLYRESLQ